MKIIDLHQDLALPYIEQPNQFISFEPETYLDVYDTNVGSLIDYQENDIQLIWGAICPYDMVKNTHYHTMMYNHAMIERYVNVYKHWVKSGMVNIIKEKSHIHEYKLNILIHIEGLDIEKTDGVIHNLYDLGIRSIGLVWNFDNKFSCCNISEKGGLTETGKKAIDDMNELGIVIDTAHMNHIAMMEVLENTKKPIINSHSNLKAFGDHTRNVYDDFLLGLEKNGGVLGLSVCQTFFGKEDVVIDDYIEQIAYVRDLIGDEHVCFGSDYQGIIHDHTIKDLGNIGSVAYLVEKVVKKFGTTFSEKFFRKNSKRIIDSILI